ncbi:DHA2 family efflux MFS transporter permease subunit [Bifidobacterium simiarum]|uniref:MFS transporter n=1 Tax=Bifidobacterium simiarum TaxID=2045441 RepID=A0A2M9HCY3_9BIFI|nr:DHA2 family efflux MFS transporter permease subunit [Bifidobacterium simiarum]PJM74679.1 MFS transporter [Bifidobacterium simiarum]
MNESRANTAKAANTVPTGNTVPAANTTSAANTVSGNTVPASLIVAVVSLAILTFLGILSETSLNIAYSTLMSEFSLEASVVQWLTTGYLLLLSVAIPSSPFMVRRFATKALFVTAVAIFTAGTVLGALAVNFPMLLAARLVMALGTGISLPLITTIILEKAPLNRRGMMLGIVSLVTCAAPAIGPVFGGVVMEYLDWHWIFYTMLPFLGVSLVLGTITVPDIRKGERASISVPSLLLVASGLAGLIVAVSFFAEWNGDWRFWVVLASSVIVLAVFAVVQLRMDRPLIQVRVFGYPGFTLGMLILLAASGGVLGLNFLLPILLQRGFGLSGLVSALILLPGAVIGAICAPMIGNALKSHFPPTFIIFGLFGVTVMDVVMVMLSGRIWAVAVAYALFMACSGFVLVPDQTHALNQLPMRLNADGSAVMNTVQQMAGAIGTAVASTLISEFSAAHMRDGLDTAGATMAAFPESMWTLTGMAVAGIVMAALMFRYSSRRTPELKESAI